MKQVTVVLAIVLVVVVMGFTGYLTFISDEGIRYAEETHWSFHLPNSETVKLIDLTGDEQDDVFSQTSNTIVVVDSQGQEIARIPTSGVATMGDTTGDGTEEIIVAESTGAGVQVAVYRGSGEQIAAFSPQLKLGPLSRIALIRFQPIPQIVIGDERGVIAALTLQGEAAWQATLSRNGDYIRGLDEAMFQGSAYTAAASHDGYISLYNSVGEPTWNMSIEQELRRLRVYDLNNDGASELFIGGERGRLMVYDTAHSTTIVDDTLGQALTQIRDGEIDNEPSSREFVVGGKEGGVWAYHFNGSQLWSSLLPERVNDMGVLDTNGDSKNEVVVGGEDGMLVVFQGDTGKRYQIKSFPGGISRLSVGTLDGTTQVVVGEARQGLHALTLKQERAPIWYSPLAAGVVFSIIIVVIAWFVASIPERPQPVLRTDAIDVSAEGLRAQRTMLQESLSDVERMKQAGEMASTAYHARLKELRKQLAENEKRLLEAGVTLTAETLSCPNCGGDIRPGQDTCSYCGTVIVR